MTWKEPRTIAVVIAWGVTEASIVLNAFLSGRQMLEWYDLLLLFSISVFAGVLLVDIKAIVLGIFESLFLSIILSYVCMILPVLVGDVAGFGQANVIYWVTIGFVFRAFFPIGIMMFVAGGMLGGFAEGLLF
jgi:hypothetical protein